MNADDLIRVMERFKELGLSSLKCEGIELSNVPSETVAPHHREASEQEIANIVADASEQMTDEEILLWSTPYYDELQHVKELRKKGNKERDNLNG